MGTATYKADGQVYEIPDNEKESFIKDIPHAEEVQSFTAGKDTFDIPLKEVPDFVKDMPEAKPLKKKDLAATTTPGAEGKISDLQNGGFPLPGSGESAALSTGSDQVASGAPASPGATSPADPNAPITPPTGLPIQYPTTAPTLRQREVELLKDKTAQVFANNPIFQDPATRDMYYKKLSEVYTPDEMKGLIGDDYERETVSPLNPLSSVSSMPVRTSPITGKEEFVHKPYEALKNPLGTIGMGVMEGLESSGKKLSESAAMIEKPNPEDSDIKTGLKATLHATQGAVEGALSIASAFVPPLMAFNLGASLAKDIAPKATEALLAPVSSSLKNVYGDKLPTWAQDAGSLADLAVGILVFHRGAKAIKGFKEGFKPTPADVKLVAGEVEKMSPDQLDKAVVVNEARKASNDVGQQVESLHNDIQNNPDLESILAPKFQELQGQAAELHDNLTNMAVTYAADEAHKSTIERGVAELEARKATVSDAGKEVLDTQIQELKKQLEPAQAEPQTESATAKPEAVNEGVTPEATGTNPDNNGKEQNEAENRQAERKEGLLTTDQPVGAGEIPSATPASATAPGGNAELHPQKGYIYRVTDNALGATGKDISFSTNTDWYSGEGFLIEARANGKNIEHHPESKRGSIKNEDITTVYYDKNGIATDKKTVEQELHKMKDRFPYAKFIEVEYKEDHNGNHKLYKKIDGSAAAALSEANTIATDLGYDHARHLLNAIKKETGNEYKNIQDIPEDVRDKFSNVKAKQIHEQLKIEYPDVPITEAETKKFIRTNEADKSEPVIAALESEASGIEGKTEAELNAIESRINEAIGGKAGVPAAVGEPRTEPSTEIFHDTEMTKMANAINDAYIEGKFGATALDAVMTKLKGTDTAKVYEKIKSKLESGEIDTKSVIKKIIRNGHGTDVDQASILYDMAKLKGREQQLRTSIIEEADGAEKNKYRRELLGVQDDMMQNTLANKMIGRDWHNIGKLRQVWADRSANLQNMMDDFKATKGTEKITPEQEKNIRDTYDKFRQGEEDVKKAQDELRDAQKELDKLKKENDILKGFRDSAKKQREADRNIKSEDAIGKSKQRVQKSLNRLRELRHTMNDATRVVPEVAIEISKIATEKIYQGAVKLDEVIKNVLDDIKDIFPEFTEKDIKEHLTHKKVSAPRSETSKILSLLKRKIEYDVRREGADYETAKKTVQEKSDNLKNAEKDYEISRFLWDKERRQDLLNNRPIAEKIGDAILSWQRFSVLSYPSTIIKLLAVVGHGLVLKPMRFAVQALTYGTTNLLGGRGITSKQSVWGKPRIKSLAKYYGSVWRSLAIENLKNNFRGVDEKEILYGNKFRYDEFGLSSFGDTKFGRGANSVLQAPGRSHGYIKSFIKNAEFEYANNQISEHYIEKTGEIEQKLQDPNLSEQERASLEKEKAQYDVSNPEVQKKIGIISTEHGKWAILMNDNKFTDRARNFLDNSGLLGKVLRTDFPIIKIPVNYVGRALATKYGLIKALTGVPKTIASEGEKGLVDLMINGTKELSDTQADLLGKTINQGSIGISLFTLGYLLHKNMKQNDDGSVDIGGIHLSHNIIHLPEYESFFSGANTAHYMSKEKNKNLKNFIEDVVMADQDILKKNPFLSTIKYGLIGSINDVLFGKTKNTDVFKNKAASILGKWVGGVTEPGFVRSAATATDAKPNSRNIHNFGFGIPYKRQPKRDGSEWDHFWGQMELGLPGLRKNVPLK